MNELLRQQLELAKESIQFKTYEHNISKLSEHEIADATQFADKMVPKKDEMLYSWTKYFNDYILIKSFIDWQNRQKQ